MDKLVEFKGLYAVIKIIKCLYFMKKAFCVLFFACLACMGVKCVCSNKKQIKKLLHSFC